MRPLACALRLDPRVDYDGTQLRPHFLRETFGLDGDVAVAFRGACSVTGDALVDLADREAGLFIHSRDMIHLLVERFDADLPLAIALQRLLASQVADRIRERLAPPLAATVTRRGDDVFVGEGKLTVSIATVSPVSTLIHLGINVDDRDTPVPTAALGPLGIDPGEFSHNLLQAFAREVEDMIVARCKVRPAHAAGEGGSR